MTPITLSTNEWAINEFQPHPYAIPTDFPFFEEDIIDTVNELLDVLGDKAYVAGGAARFLMAKEFIPETDRPSDVDLFLWNDAELLNVQKVLSSLYTPTFSSKYALTYKPLKTSDHLIPVQLVTPLITKTRQTFGHPKTVLSGFSLDIESFAIYKEKGKVKQMDLFGKTEQLPTMLTKTVHLRAVDNPLTACVRLNKYGRKGYHVPHKDILKLFDAWEALPKEEQVTLIQWFKYQSDTYG